MSSEGKDHAREILLGGEEDLTAIASATGLSEASVRGIKGALVRAGELESTSKKKKKTETADSDDVDLANDEDLLRQVLGLAKCSKKDIEAVIEIADSYGIDSEGISEALKEQGVKKSVQKRVMSLWRAKAGEELPAELEDELGLGPRRDSRLPKDFPRSAPELAEFLDKRDREREEKNRLQRLEEKVDRLLPGGLASSQGKFRETRVPIDANGAPCDPNKAVSVRYERVPTSEGGDVSLLRREISDLKEKISSDQIAELSHQVQELSQKIGQTGSDVSAIVTGVKDIMSSWSSSQGGPLARAASPLVDAYGRRVLENYQALSPMTPEMQQPQTSTPPSLVAKLRDSGLVTAFRRREVEAD